MSARRCCRDFKPVEFGSLQCVFAIDISRAKCLFEGHGDQYEEAVGRVCDMQSYDTLLTGTTDATTVIRKKLQNTYPALMLRKLKESSICINLIGKFYPRSYSIQCKVLGIVVTSSARLGVGQPKARTTAMLLA